jgi:hypothetical protein
VRALVQQHVLGIGSDDVHGVDRLHRHGADIERRAVERRLPRHAR